MVYNLHDTCSRGHVHEVSFSALASSKLPTCRIWWIHSLMSLLYARRLTEASLPSFFAEMAPPVLSRLFLVVYFRMKSTAWFVGQNLKSLIHFLVRRKLFVMKKTHTQLKKVRVCFSCQLQASFFSLVALYSRVHVAVLRKITPV